MLTAARRETIIQSALNHRLRTDPGTHSQFLALEGSPADTPGRARNAANRNAGGQAVRGEPGSARRHGRSLRDSDSGACRVFVVDRQGVHVGRVAVQVSGSFNVLTAGGKVQGVSHRLCRIVQRGDGCECRLDMSRKKETAAMQGTRDPAFLPVLKDGVSCGVAR